MKKQFLNIGLALLFTGSLSGYAQSTKTIPCNTDEAMQDVFAKDPQAKARYEAAQAQLLQEFIQNKNQSAKSAAAAFVYTLPVVFHILHTYGPENINDADCIGALAQVNSDLAKMGADAASVAPPWNNLYINSDIKLMFARKDPSGNCTNGIVHRYDTRTVWDRSGNLNVLYNGIIWDPTKYLNIIIVKEIVAQSGQAGIVVGYTYKPGTWSTGAAQDAIVYRYNYLSGLTARSLTHELGHWLNLNHTFGSTNNPGVTCGDDFLFDTPPTKGALGGCPTSASGNSCAGTTSVYAAGQDNIENIMGYWDCPKNFTTDQTNAIRTACGSVISGRQNLWQTANLIATDVNATIPCAPIAEYISTNQSYTVCNGGSLTMKDISYNGTITNFAWTANNGAVITSGSSSVTNITFPTIGTSIVTLSVSNGQGSSTKTRNVTVLDATPGITGPSTESFENAGIPVGWTVTNPDANSATWEQSYDAFAYDGIACFFINGSLTAMGQKDILETPVIDIASNTNKAFTFGLAYAQASTTHNDKLSIQGSKDCGGTWTNIITLSANQMALNSGGQISLPFTPSSSFEWKSFDIATYPLWNSFTSSSSVKLRFLFEASTNTVNTGKSNNIFIDAINLFGASTSINELTKTYQFNMLPNPTDGEVTINFKLDDLAKVKINVLDMLGKEVLPSYEASISAGSQSININKNNTLSPGVYFVNLSVNGAKMSKKLIIN
jgi:hypothetical protein